MVLDDSKRWDMYHKKTFEEEADYSSYAESKEALFPRNSIILDLGGGVGSDALYFLQKGHKVIILDISNFALKIAFERAKKMGLEKNLKVMQIDFSLHQLPVNRNSVDICYSRISLNYFGTEETTKLLFDINETLKPGGKAYLTFKSLDDIAEIEYLKKSAVLFEENVFIDNGQLRSRFSITQLNRMLENAGIKDREVSPYLEKLKYKTPNAKDSLSVNEVVFTKPL